MPKLTVSVPHQLPVEDVVPRVQPALEKTVRDFQGHDLVLEAGADQTNFKFKSMAFTIRGQTRVTADAVIVEVELPIAALMFKDKAQQQIHKNISRALDGTLRWPDPPPSA